MEKQNIPSTITLKKDKVVAHHISDGSELIPSEIQASTREEINQCLNKSLEGGYTIDDEGIINNYATEPDLLLANYPSPEQQKRYIFLGAGATLLITITLLTAFAVS
ncbi:ssl1498 family light-harvesting-like protein [Waterburya agarophytonicola K14]|uniref:Ssl1498 family light-harvesting-like protein n=1 Tax=Waterburya agarophytonicola KI4 TaxID=2874699 RepID=A0A964BWI1_9CYAN|nr:ssl1498 family light-harvesting-like protein [Waterburya agarophytonicola]MCC0179617.1 ssl1498 family light-harvesting-like protein [Waterburya agarophytonicola KI4]